MSTTLNDPLDLKPATQDITQLLSDWQQGHPQASDQLVRLVYQTLRHLAAKTLQNERANHTLQPTALVHEAYFRLVGYTEITWQNRSHFFAIAAQTMRRIVTDYARANLAQKRGGPHETLSLEAIPDIGSQDPQHILFVHEALDSLFQVDLNKARLVELRFFAGLSIEECAELLNCSRATLIRQWRLAKAWLLRAIENKG
ncbi:MAG: sigma-70 family RNA polymerase sigma factor [Acidobacteria bacterium]|nr:sigma-70 family RNA polymerase sigma factor [Acidobacteriota bacterium]